MDTEQTQQTTRNGFSSWIPFLLSSSFFLFLAWKVLPQRERERESKKREGEKSSVGFLSKYRDVN